MGRKTSLVDYCIFGALLLVGVSCIILYFCQFNIAISNDQDAFGYFGDYIGGVLGTLLSLLSIVYIYKTYRKQVDFSVRQEELSILQQFEASFFNLMQSQRSILMSLKYDSCSAADLNDRSDYSYMSAVAYELKRRLMDFEYDVETITHDNIEDVRASINDIYKEIYITFGLGLGHYFRNLYNILKYINEAEISNKQKYINLVQAQMSNDELYLCFYNSISDYGKDKMYPLVENYGFLENLSYNEFEYFRKQKEIFYPHTNFKQ